VNAIDPDMMSRFVASVNASGAKILIFDPIHECRETEIPEPRSIPATAVIRVLQRVAELQAERVRFCLANGQYLSIKADGWTLICGLDRGDLDGLFHCVTPDGEYFGLTDWSIEADPIDMLGDATAWAVVQRFHRECRT
jgi:hypothetical protein